MKINHVGEMVFDQEDLADHVMQGHDIMTWQGAIVDPDVDTKALYSLFKNTNVCTWQQSTEMRVSLAEFDRVQQSNWHMPDEYKTLDIAEWILKQCTSPEQLQRCGQELLLYQERGLFNLLRYLKYLVDTMRKNHIIWGIGRGSSVASYVLFLIGVHRIDSMYYDLDPTEFLR